MSDFIQYQKAVYLGDWIEQGACKGLTNIFFAPLSERPQATERREARARAICNRCPVFNECRDYARNNGEYGFWAGENEYDRALEGYYPKFGVLRTTTLRFYKDKKEASANSTD
jgi:hypothetical protein